MEIQGFVAYLPILMSQQLPQCLTDLTSLIRPGDPGDLIGR